MAAGARAGACLGAEAAGRLRAAGCRADRTSREKGSEEGGNCHGETIGSHQHRCSISYPSGSKAEVNGGAPPEDFLPHRARVTDPHTSSLRHLAPAPERRASRGKGGGLTDGSFCATIVA